MEIRDPYFDKIQVPSFALGFPIVDFLPENRFTNSTYRKKFDYDNASLLHKIFMEFKSLNVVDCKLKNNGVYEDCDNFAKPYIEIYSGIYSYSSQPDVKFKLDPILGLNQKQQILYELIESMSQRPNQTFIEQLKIYNEYILGLSYLLFNQNEKNSNEFNKSTNPSNTIRENDFIKLSMNLQQYYKNEDYRYAGLYLSSKKYSIREKIDLKISFGRIYELNVIKKSFKFLEFPYESKCSYYEKFGTFFKSLSHNHCIRQCIRQCIRHYCEFELKCSCIGIENTISQMDYEFRKIQICRKDPKLMESFVLKTMTFCKTLCPKDCINDEYIIAIRKVENIDPYVKHKLFKLTMNWDVSKPIITNKETPVMTFTDYFCYIGGLFGMWFGISANQLFENLIKNHRKYYRDFINFNLILFYTLLEIIIFIKAKFQSTVRYTYYRCRNKII
jgi:hypothetical protein